MLLTLILLPAVAGAAAFIIPRDRARRALLIAAALAHLGLTVAAGIWPPAPVSGWLALDGLGYLFLCITSGLFLCAAVYAAGYLSREEPHPRQDFFEGGQWFHNAPEAVFTGNLLLFLSCMTLVMLAHHFGLLWVAVETTTLATAPLIYFHRHHRSLEATWKYLVVCSVGIALALLGTYILAAAAARASADGVRVPVTLEALVENAKRLDPAWTRAAFLFLLVGYGTKMGLAPIHTWLPDAHSEAPSVVSALLSGALLNGAFVGILRAAQVCSAAGQGEMCHDLLLAFGLVSLGMAAVFVVGQTDFKRLLAYSSVEHMGILALGVGIGGTAAAQGVVLHGLNHSVAKGLLFMVAGNILGVYRTKNVGEVRGVLSRLPISGALWVLGILAITGTPPFGAFMSELAILKAALDAGRWGVALGYLAALAVIFVAMISTAAKMAQGSATGADPAGAAAEPAGAPPANLGPHAAARGSPATSRGQHGPGAAARVREPLSAYLPAAALAALALLLGLWLPAPVKSALDGAAVALGGIK
ncbi:MAG: NADH dehydrogenase FAD-containing subunit [Planctomycetes bacterium]|nr:NADH dehydrogenase FAD-containing subunit [Planctomycetota bacterium]